MKEVDFKKYIKYIKHSKINKNLLILEMLSSLDFENLWRLQNKVPKMFQGVFKAPQLKKKRFEDIFTTGRMLSYNAIDLYGALAFVIINNAIELNQYVLLKDQLDLAVAEGNYTEAYRLLKKIEDSISASMFGTYYELRLTRLDKGISEATNLHNVLCERNSVLASISTQVFKTSHIDLPIELEADRFYNLLHGKEESRDFLTYIAYPYKEPRGFKWMALLFATSLIDLYEGFLYQLSYIDKEELCTLHMKELIRHLAKSINDPRIHRLYSLIYDGNLLENSPKLTEEKDLIENYYSENYHEVIRKGIEYFKRNPLEATVIDLYYKSHIKLCKIPEEVFPIETLAGRLHHLYYSSLLTQSGSEISRALLRSLSIAWYQIPSVKQIYHTFKDIDSNHGNMIYKNYWRHSLVPEIRDALFFHSQKDAINYLSHSGYNRNESSLIKILENRKKDEFNQTLCMLYGLQHEDIEKYRDVLLEDIAVPIISECLLYQVFTHLKELRCFDDAISLYVKCRLINSYRNIYIDKKEISKLLTDEDDRNIHNQLELAIFYTMIESDSYKRYLAYKRYLKSQGLLKASDIQDLTTPELKYFIGKVVDRNVLTLHVVAFDTEKDVVNERIKLCRKIFNVIHDKSYTEEITNLIKEQEVLTLAQQINDSKIHVDTQSLINTQLIPEKFLFDIYSQIDENTEIVEQQDVDGLLDFLARQNINSDRFEGEGLPTAKYKQILCRELVLSIRDKFLFNPNYGLDKYLSARIRHGTLITQLRNHFLSHQLVTNKKEGEIYERISPWTIHPFAAILSDTNKEAINDRLLSFTEWLDDKLQNIKDEIIQIKTERHQSSINGLFDYTDSLLNDKIVTIEKNNFNSFDALLYPVLDLLWKRTEEDLTNIRRWLRHYEEEVIYELHYLQNDVTNLMAQSPQIVVCFKDAVTHCITDFQQDIALVSNWFKLEQSNVKYFTMQQVVDTSLSVINKITQNSLSFNLISISDKNLYRGEYFNLFHDIFHDLMNNILAYETKRPNVKGYGDIIIKESSGKLQIKVRNPLDRNDVVDLKILVENQSDFPALIEKGKTRREKNSGCAKIYSTVMFTLGQDNKYSNIIENDSFNTIIEIGNSNLIYNEDIDCRG